MVEKRQLKPDLEKIRAVVEWPVLATRKQPQKSLGFASFSRRFICNYSRITAPLTQSTSVKKPFDWSLAAQATFENLKAKFTAAPVLTHPDPDFQFIVEDPGVGAILSQHLPADHKLHRCLTPTERNYDVGNQELLVVVLALQDGGPA